MLNDPYVSPRGTFSHPDWEHDPRIQRQPGSWGTLIGGIAAIALIVAILMVILATAPQDTAQPTPPPATVTQPLPPQ